MTTYTKTIRGIVGVIILNLVSSLLYSIIKDIDIFAAFINLWGIIILSIFNFLTINIQIWQVLILLVFSLLLFVILSNFRIKNKLVSEPDYMKFLSGIYKGINYRWTLYRYGNTISIEKFRPTCSCGADLTIKWSYGNSFHSHERLFCVNCNKFIPQEYNDEIDKDANLYFTNILNMKIDEFNNK